MAPKPKGPAARLQGQVTKKFCGTSVEKQDGTHACDYFAEKYKTQAEFTAIFDQMEAKVLAVRPSACPMKSLTVLGPSSPDEGGPGVEGWLPQKKIGYMTGHAVRGRPDMVQVLEACVSFINSTKYNSQEHPIFALFPDMTAGEFIENFSVHHNQGMTRTLACKIIVETVFDMGLNDQDFKVVLPLVVSCLWVKYVYDPAPTYEEEVNRSIIKKFQVSEAARPTVLQLLDTFLTEFRMSGKEQSNDSIMNRIKEFNNKSGVEGQNISYLEGKAIILLAGMRSSFIDVLKHHWQNFKSAESAITLGS